MSLSKRNTDDLMLLAYVKGAQRHMPSTPLVRAVERFVQEFGHHCEECDTQALIMRYLRMEKEHLELKRHGEEG